jgi:hypothetical protein
LLFLEDGEELDSPTTNGNEENHIPLHSSQSNPHLLDMDTTPQDETDSTIDKVAFYFLIISHLY